MGDLAKYLVIGFGGSLGAVARYAASAWVHSFCGASFPYGTLAVNLSGSFLLGLFATLAFSLAWNDYWRLLIAVGFLGAFTTFSTFEYETIQLVMHGGSYRQALSNIVVSVAGGFAAVYVGIVLGRLLLSLKGWSAG